jgi:NAD(P)-dependent dehydrogenase (short-subunit alcohol dehydrogenase family)
VFTPRAGRATFLAVTGRDFAMPTVLIAGASRGIGLEFARQYAVSGWNVIGTVRDAEAKARLAETAPGADVVFADMADRAAIAALGETLKGRPIDLLICNAGMYGPRDVPFGKSDFSAWEQVLKVNVFGPAALIEALIDNVVASERKQIVLISSGAGSNFRNKGKNHIYKSSKTALNSVMRSFAGDLAERGVTVISMHPGHVRTAMGGPQAVLDVAESVSAQKKVFDALTFAQSGMFFQWDGTEVPF